MMSAVRFVFARFQIWRRPRRVIGRRGKSFSVRSRAHRLWANRFYLVSSVCFLGGAILALRAAMSPINVLYVLGSAFFVLAAGASVVAGRRR
jgi:hypothetical protein